MRSLPLGTALFLAMLAGCSTTDHPTLPASTPNEKIRFVPLDDSSVEVHWADPAFDRAIVSWEKENGEEVGRIESGGMTARIADLDPDESYSVVVRERTPGGLGRLIRSILGRREPLAAATALEATSLNSTSVGLRWEASPTAGATYLVSYRKIGSSGALDTGSSAVAGSGIVISGNSATVTGLTAGGYNFWVRATKGSSMSTGSMLAWAPASRYTVDAATPSTSIRMYEFASLNGAGLILDPAKGGPRNANVSQSSPDPAGSIALAIFTGPGVPPNTFDIGPAYAFIGFRNANKFDSSAYISDAAYSVFTLDDLYLRNALETYITPGGVDAGNIKAFNLPYMTPDGKSIVFIMRIGNGANRHYARVLVRVDPATGRVLRGTAPNRYVEVEISYQSVANLPYAKGVVRTESVPAYRARVR